MTTKCSDEMKSSRFPLSQRSVGSASALTCRNKVFHNTAVNEEVKRQATVNAWREWFLHEEVITEEEEASSET